MKKMAVAQTYATHGSVALKPVSREFVVIEGTRGNDDQFTPNKLTFAQIVIAYLVIAAFTAILAAAWAFADASIQSRVTVSLAEVESTSIYVRPGDSIWALAEEHPIEGYGTADVVRWIEEKNSLNSATIIPGQQLEVPTQTEN